jgi:hypothetical protein
MANTYTLISSNVLTSNATSISFTGIGTSWTDILLKISGRTDRSGTVADSLQINFNSDTSTNYSDTFIYNTYTGANASNTFGSSLGTLDASTATANTFGSIEIYIPNYQLTTNRPFSAFGVQEDNAASNNIAFNANLYIGTSAITSITLTPTNGPNFVSGSSFYLYGISNA